MDVRSGFVKDGDSLCVGRVNMGRMVRGDEVDCGLKRLEWGREGHTDSIYFQVNFKADSLTDAGSTVQGRAAGASVSIWVAGWSLRDWSRSGSCVGEDSEKSSD